MRRQRLLKKSCRFQHIFAEDNAACNWLIYQNMGDGADELAVLNDQTTSHE